MCTTPMIRAETFEKYTNKKGGISYKAEIWGDARQYDKDFGKWALNTGRYRKIELIPCGQCIECQLAYSRDKATQMMLELNYGYKGGKYPDGTAWFITSTYADEYLKTHKYVQEETGEIFEGVSLSKEDSANYHKRIRYYFPEMKSKYVVAGEYGSRSGRPHLHDIFFGMKLDPTRFTEKHLNKLGQPCWRCKELEDIWGMGRVTVGRVEWRSCAYVARYTLKKAFKKNKQWYMAQGMLPEFIHWSNGIGKDYLIANKDKIYETDSVPIVNHIGASQKPPKSYDRILQEVDPELYEKIKRQRQVYAKNQELAMRFQTDLRPDERRKVAEARMASVMKDLRLEV